MDTTYADIQAEARLDIAVEFITRRAIDCPDGRVHRLLVADQNGTEFAILTTPDSDPIRDLKTGATHRITSLLGATPPDATETTDATCPNCGGALRPGTVADAAGPTVAEAATELGLDARIGIIDNATTIRRVRPGTTTVDDWTPMHDDDDGRVAAPDYVCTDCRRHTASQHHHDAPEADHALDEFVENVSPAPATSDMASPETVGLATGGAKDVTNFRENVIDGYTPQPEAISDEGLFYDYHFETGERTDSDSLFAPRYAAAVTEHPISGETEQYLSVGLDSTLSVADFERPRLDLVAVFDVSGSMTSPFDAYYYDEHGRKREAEPDASTKLAAATQSLCALTQQLHPDDRLGVVLYNHRAHVAKPLRDVGTTDMPAIRRHIRDITADGSTNLADGFEAAVDMLADHTGNPRDEQRVVFLTDMMPNTGATGDSELTELFTDAAANGIHTTFVGMGLDANAELADTLSGIRGANHYFVHSAQEFKQRLGEEFAYMVSPLVYDLDLELRTDGYQIASVHGSPSADAATGELMHVGTLFPSAKQDGEARGGVVLVRLEETRADADLELVASWTERNGSDHTERVTVEIPDDPETFAHDGIRKAVALARYARELRAWSRDVHERADATGGIDDWLLGDDRGDHERESVPLTVPQQSASRFVQLHDYLADEMDAVGDDTLQQELDLLDILGWEAPTAGAEVPNE